MLKSTLACIINCTIGNVQKANTSNLKKTKGLTEININDFNKKKKKKHIVHSILFTK